MDDDAATVIRQHISSPSIDHASYYYATVNGSKLLHLIVRGEGADAKMVEVKIVDEATSKTLQTEGRPEGY